MSVNGSPVAGNLGITLGDDPDDDDFCRGYGSLTNMDAELDGNFFEDDGEIDSGKAAAPTMPTDFYEDVEKFLSKGPPVLKSGMTGGHGKKKKKQSGATTKEAGSKMKGNSGGVHLPKISSSQSANELDSNMHYPSVATDNHTKQQGTKSSKKIRYQSSSTVGSTKKEVDQSLLKEAFAYADQLLKDALVEEQSNAAMKMKADDARNDALPVSKGFATRRTASDNLPYAALMQQQQQHQHQQQSSRPLPRSAPSDSAGEKQHSKASGIADAYGNTQPNRGAGVSGNTGSGRSMVKKLRSKTQQQQPQNSNRRRSSGGQRSGTGTGVGGTSGGIYRSSVDETGHSFSVSEVPERNLQKNALNFDQLVANFQDGTTMRTLQKELAQSQQSMAKSEQFLKQLSREYFS